MHSNSDSRLKARPSTPYFPALIESKVPRTVENRKLCPGPRSGSGAVLGEAHSDYYSWSRVAALGAVSAAKRPKRLRVKTLSIQLHRLSLAHEILFASFSSERIPLKRERLFHEVEILLDHHELLECVAQGFSLETPRSSSSI